MKGKRFLAALMALMLTFGTMSFTALAETGDGSGTSNTEGNTASSIKVTVSYSRDGAFVTGADGTLLCKAEVTVNDDNKDGVFTMSEAFRAMHREYYSGGVDGYADTDSGWITKVWGVDTANVSYLYNNSWVYGTTQVISDGGFLALYEYQDLSMWGDLYTYFEQDNYEVPLNTEQTFTVTGISVMNSGQYDGETVTNATAAPKGATVKVYDNDGNVVDSMTTVVDEKGQFKLSFATDGIYTIEVSGKCDYTCAGYGGSYTAEYEDEPVVPARCTVKAGKGDALLGDVNGDGMVDLSDVISLLNSVTAEEEVSLKVGDINGDESVDLSDVITLLNQVTEAE
jgi:hypothetical protein